MAAFTVSLDNFNGPFDLLLQLITRRKLDVTQVALSVVTDEFIEHVKLGNSGAEPWDLDQTTEFLVVAATLLDLKAARLLPAGEVEDDEDLAVLEARDLLFARLLQYRAFKQVAGQLATQLASESRRLARPGGLEEHFRRLLPEVDLGLTPDAFAALAARALTPREAPEVSLAHLHASQVSVAEQARIVSTRVRSAGRLAFRVLVADAADRLVVVARFLALLQLARRRAVAFEQPHPLGELVVVWTGEPGSLDDDLTSAFDEFDGLPAAQEGLA